MKTYHVGFDEASRVAHVSEDQSKVPSGSLDLGSFDLPEDEDDDFGGLRNDGTHTIFHGVRDKLYHIGHQNMAAVEIHVTH